MLILIKQAIQVHYKTHTHKNFSSLENLNALSLERCIYLKKKKKQAKLVVCVAGDRIDGDRSEKETSLSPLLCLLNFELCK